MVLRSHSDSGMNLRIEDQETVRAQCPHLARRPIAGKL
jgi:hypothetical protein